MRYATIFRVLGLLIMIFSLSIVPSIFIEYIYKDGSMAALTFSLIITLLVGFTIWFPFRNKKHELRTRDGFFIVVLFWTTLCAFGTLPFMLSPFPNISITDAVFESVSGITTTGSTVIHKLDLLPHSILFYRQVLQFLGGIGIIILAVAILPMLGVGGMQLFRAEFTGPIKDNKLTPRITQTAKAIWLIYVTMALLCGISYWLGGMEPFDAICFSFSTISTGGYAPHDASMGYYANPLLKVIAIIFMFMSAISFNLHFIALHSRKTGMYSKDPELKVFVRIIFLAFVFLWIGFAIFGFDKTNPNILIDSLFQIVSLATTTGLATTEFATWPSYIPLMLLFLGVIGGCAGSTSGGLKVIRFLLLMKQGTREIHRLIHPHAHYVIKLGNTPVQNRVIEAIWGFLAIYIAIFTTFLLALLLTEMDFYTAYTALIATFSNIGPGLGNVASNFSSLSDFSKWILSFAMLVGRLEIFTVLVLFSRAFWKS